MERLFRKKEERTRSIWRRAVNLALTDVRVLAGGMDEELLEALEERLLAADFGVTATLRLVGQVEASARRGKIGSGDLRTAMRDEVGRILEPARHAPLHAVEDGPTVYLIVGVNGAGKTTSVAKLAKRVRDEGRSVLVAAADTYRAGAVEQLAVWVDRIGVEFVRGQQGGDPAAVAFDALEAATARDIDVVLVDTAGRLHTDRGLMEQLRKVERVVRRKIPGAPHETLIVLDATVGQNALAQVRSFGGVVELSGIVLAKLDSTARGGVVVALQEEYGLPVKLVGKGEGLDDLEIFDVDDFIEGVFGEA